MTAKRIVFLSDIHIGLNAPTNWYQRDLHEPMLAAIFEHVIAGAAGVAELVILGDLVDQWTYLPSASPPSVGDIAAANPVIFGKDGAIARAARAMPESSSGRDPSHEGGVQPRCDRIREVVSREPQTTRCGAGDQLNNVLTIPMAEHTNPVGCDSRCHIAIA
jgi:hypothetical protein